MIEAGAKEVPEEEMLEAFAFGHEAVKKIAAFISEIQKEVGKTKSVPALLAGTPEFEAKIKEIYFTGRPS